MYEFQHPRPVTVALQAISGVVEIAAEDRDTVEVVVEPLDDRDAAREAADKTRVVLEGDTLVIEVPRAETWRLRRSPRLAITARVPAGSALTGRSAAADVRASGVWSAVKLDVASADVRIDAVTGDVSLDAASGDLAVGHVGGALKMDGASGDLRADDVTGDVKAKSASGGIHLGAVGGSVKASTASGEVRVGRLHQGRSDISTASGDVRVGIAAGTGIWLDLNAVSGRMTSDLAPRPDTEPVAASDATVELKVRTASGDIHIHRAAESMAA